MMYEVAHQEKYAEELQEAINAQTKDSNFIRIAMGQKKIDFEKNVIDKLLNCRNWKNFTRHVESLRRKGVIGHDDYSIAIM